MFFLTILLGSISIGNASKYDKGLGAPYLESTMAPETDHPGLPTSTVAIQQPAPCENSRFYILPSVTSQTCESPQQNSSNTYKNQSQSVFIGLNVVNTQPGQNSPRPFKTREDWSTAFQHVKNFSPRFNAVRMYSTTDVQSDGMLISHLMNALPAAREQNLSILVGVWSGGPWTQARFYQEAWALRQVLSILGCQGIAAVSVGNKDLNDVNKSPGLTTDTQRDNTKEKTIATLVDQMQQIRDLLREYQCYDIPVTHTDTLDEWNGSSPDVGKLMNATDSFITVNLFPYWGNATSIDDATQMFKIQWGSVKALANTHGKEVWMSETGWPSQDQLQDPYGIASPQNAQAYLDNIECSVLNGSLNAFYYVDWDEDAQSMGKPSFGLMSVDGTPKIKLNC